MSTADVLHLPVEGGTRTLLYKNLVQVRQDVKKMIKNVLNKRMRKNPNREKRTTCNNHEIKAGGFDLLSKIPRS